MLNRLARRIFIQIFLLGESEPFHQGEASSRCEALNRFGSCLKYVALANFDELTAEANLARMQNCRFHFWKAQLIIRGAKLNLERFRNENLKIKYHPFVHWTVYLFDRQIAPALAYLFEFSLYASLSLSNCLGIIYRHNAVRLFKPSSFLMASWVLHN